MSPDLKMEVQKHPNIEEFHTLAIQYQNSWTTPILSFLRDGRLLADIDEAKKFRKWVTRFTILNDALYKRGFSMPYLKCVEEDEVRYILEEISKNMWRPHGPKIPGKQDHQNRLLLAYHAERRKGIHWIVRQVPEVRERPTCPRREYDGHNFLMGICSMGDRYRGPTTSR